MATELTTCSQIEWESSCWGSRPGEVPAETVPLIKFGRLQPWRPIRLAAWPPGSKTLHVVRSQEPQQWLPGHEVVTPGQRWPPVVPMIGLKAIIARTTMMGVLFGAVIALWGRSG
ncbi:hypothetical protein GCM10010176_098100 [Nonomuraea spiralis]|nr:hypothetical protein GCM10010176_098100 [Nonomuraea spiralis]